MTTLASILYILIVRSSPGPLHLMLADTPLPHGFGAALASVDTLSKGSRTVRCLPALPWRLRATGRTVCAVPSGNDTPAALRHISRRPSAFIGRSGCVRVSAKAVCQHLRAASGAWSRRLQPTCLLSPPQGLPERRGSRPYGAR